MKIAVASSGKNLDSLVDSRFGRCPYFLILNEENDEFEVLENTAGQAFRGAGISAAQMIANKGVGAIIAGNFGPNALNVLQSSGIKIFGGVTGVTIKEAFERYKDNKLEEIKTSAVNSGRGFGSGRGGRW